jgi:hypothetical protein
MATGSFWLASLCIDLTEDVEVLGFEVLQKMSVDCSKNRGLVELTLVGLLNLRFISSLAMASMPS